MVRLVMMFPKFQMQPPDALLARCLMLVSCFKSLSEMRRSKCDQRKKKIKKTPKDNSQPHLCIHTCWMLDVSAEKGPAKSSSRPRICFRLFTTLQHSRRSQGRRDEVRQLHRSFWTTVP